VPGRSSSFRVDRSQNAGRISPPKQAYFSNHEPDKRKSIPVTVPKGAVVKVVNSPLDGTRLGYLEWDGETIMMFTADVRERGGAHWAGVSRITIFSAAVF